MAISKKIVLAADHAGFDLKEKLKSYLQKKGYEITDISPKLIEGDDYPEAAFLAGKEVVKKRTAGIFICGSGEGMCISANKVKGVRAALAYDVQSAKESREHNNANVLCLGARRLKEKDAIKISDVWLSATFLGERHERRVNKIISYERFRLS